jgi:hypothetical protein
MTVVLRIYPGDEHLGWRNLSMKLVIPGLSETGLAALVEVLIWKACGPLPSEAMARSWQTLN